jgi:hypothetical protein
VGECRIVILFAVKVEVDQLIVKVKGRCGLTRGKDEIKVDRQQVEGRGWSTD